MGVDNKYTFHLIGDDKTKKAFASVAASVRKTVNLAGTLGAGVAAGLAVMVTRSVEANTAMVRLGHSVGVGAQAMTEWAHAAQTVELQGEKVADIFKDVSERIGELASTGTGEGKEVFEKLNIDVREFVGLAPDQQLLKIAGALDQVQTRSEKIFILESLASDASRLLPLLDNNAEKLRALQTEAQQLGTSISGIDAAKLEAANRSMERVQSLTSGFATQLSVEVSPIIEVIAENIVGVASEGDRMGQAISKAFGFGGKAVGVFGDGLHGIHVIIKGLELAMTGFGAVVVSVIELGVRSIFQFAAEVNEVINVLIEGMNKLPKVDIPLLQTDIDEIGAVKFVTKLGDAMRDKTAEVRTELHNLLMEELPSGVIKENIDRILDEAEARAAQRLAETNARLTQGTDLELKPIEVTATRRETDPAVEDRLQAERDRIAERLARVDESYMTESELLRAHFDEELAITQRAHNLLLINDEEYEQRKQAIQKASEGARISMVTAGLQQILSFTAHGSKKLFKVQKALSLAQAAVTLPSAIIKSFNNAGGYPWGIVPAIAMALEGATQIAAIKNQQLDGGSSVPSVGSGGSGSGSLGPAPAAVANTNVGSQFTERERERPQTVVQFHISGDVIGDNGETVLGKIKTLIEDTDVVLFGPNSRQAQELIVS